MMDCSTYLQPTGPDISELVFRFDDVMDFILLQKTSSVFASLSGSVCGL